MSYRIKQIERLYNSTNGNPRFRFVLEDRHSGRFVDADLLSDASIGYEIGNPGYRVGSTVDVKFTKDGRVSDMTAVKV